MKPKLLWGPILCLLSAAGALQATLVPRMSLEEVVQRSDLIVHGRVLRTWAAWDAEHRFIWTHSEIQVSEALKGAPGATVVVSEPGGVVGDMELSVSGMPRYQPGEEVVLFLFRTETGRWRARGLGQGSYKVEADAAGTKRVRMDLQGAALMEPAGARLGAAAEPASSPLREFKTRVRSLAQQSKGTH